MPFFSIVVPTYNRAALLPRCLESLRRQTFQDFDVFVVDDGSTDDTRSIVERFSAEDRRIYYLYQANAGAADARNLGAARSHGQYLAFLDSDDEAVPDWLASLGDALKRKKWTIVCCGIQFLSREGEVTGHRLPRGEGSGGSVLDGLFRSGTFAIRREAFQLVGGYASGLPANQHSELRCRLEVASRSRSWSVACLPRILIHAHDHQGIKIRQDAGAIYRSACYVLEHHSELLKEDRLVYASWASACAGAAARLGKLSDARLWWCRAILAYPANLRNYVRVALTLTPWLGSRFWR